MDTEDWRCARARTAAANVTRRIGGQATGGFARRTAKQGSAEVGACHESRMWRGASHPPNRIPSESLLCEQFSKNRIKFSPGFFLTVWAVPPHLDEA